MLLFHVAQQPAWLSTLSSLRVFSVLVDPILVALVHRFCVNVCVPLHYVKIDALCHALALDPVHSIYSPTRCLPRGALRTSNKECVQVFWPSGFLIDGPNEYLDFVSTWLLVGTASTILYKPASFVIAPISNCIRCELSWRCNVFEAPHRVCGRYFG